MKKENKTANVEFGIEFGDLNAVKNYEISYSNQKNKHEQTKNKRKK